MRLRLYFPMLLAGVMGCGRMPIPQPTRTEPPPSPVGETPLVPPMLLQKEALEAGNPLATYAAILELEDRYRKSKPLAGVYDEVRCNFEEGRIVWAMGLFERV